MITPLFLKIKGLPHESKGLLMSANLPLGPLREHRECKTGTRIATASRSPFWKLGGSLGRS